MLRKPSKMYTLQRTDKRPESFRVLLLKSELDYLMQAIIWDLDQLRDYSAGTAYPVLFDNGYDNAFPCWDAAKRLRRWLAHKGNGLKKISTILHSEKIIVIATQGRYQSILRLSRAEGGKQKCVDSFAI